MGETRRQEKIAQRLKLMQASRGREPDVLIIEAQVWVRKPGYVFVLKHKLSRLFIYISSIIPQRNITSLLTLSLC